VVHLSSLENQTSRAFSLKKGHSNVAEQTENTGEFTRRQALKKTGAILGASLWVTPVVQIVNMQPAFAQATSGPRSGNGNPPGGNGGNGGGGNEIATNVTAGQPPGGVNGPIAGGEIVGGIQVQAPAGDNPETVRVVAQTDALPLTGVDADKLGSVAAGMAAAGIAALEAARRLEKREQTAESEGL
jgi:hypothetical protein